MSARCGPIVRSTTARSRGWVSTAMTSAASSAGNGVQRAARPTDATVRAIPSAASAAAARSTTATASGGSAALDG